MQTEALALQHSETSWTLIHGAAEGDAVARGHFTRRFLPVVRAYLRARWRGSRYLDEVEDAVQEVFVDCFRDGGVLERADRERGGFRTFLMGVVRKAALRTEQRCARERDRRATTTFHPNQQPASDATLSEVFDAAWARAIMKETAEAMADRARSEGGELARYVELLRLRFMDGLPIRDIAKRWDVDAPAVHRAYRRARREFKRTLREVVATHHCCGEEEVEHECRQLALLMS